MYTMVMMMAMSGSTDTTAFGGKLFGGGCHGNSCHGAMVVSTGCTGSHAAPTVPAPAYTGCSGTSCHGGSGFLGLRSHFSRKSGCHGSTGCHGYAAAPAAADCCGTTAAYSTGCVGSIVTGGTPGAVITETPAAGVKEMPKAKDAPKVEKKGDGV